MSKTSGQQIQTMLNSIGFGFNFLNTSKDNGNLRVMVDDNLPTLSVLVEACEKNGIDPMFVTIDTTWGHLNIVFSQWDGTYPED